MKENKQNKTEIKIKHAWKNTGIFIVVTVPSILFRVVVMTVPVSVFVTVPASMAVTSTTVTVPVRMTVKQKKTQQVDDETGDAHVQHPVLVFDFLIVGQPLDRLHENGEAECDQEYGIHESTNYFCPRPAVSIFLGMKLWYLKYTKCIAYNTESKHLY